VAKILVIDDARMMRIYLQRCLEQAGLEVEAWMPDSAMEVLDHIRASAPDLLLCDYRMPAVNGATIVRMVHKAGLKLPMLILTAFRDDDMEQALLRLGVRQILTKPIDPQALVLAVQGALEAPDPDLTGKPAP
jgi:DNA-binding NarL/FixJ family response regulator